MRPYKVGGVHLSREKIVAAALQILDQYGLADLSMRRLATGLGVAPGALYWHIPNKQHLIEFMAQSMLSSLLNPPTQPLSPSEFARTLRSLVLAHTDGGEVLVAGLSMPGLRDQLTQRAQEVMRAAHAPAPALAAQVLIDAIVGAVLVEQSQVQLAQLTGQPTAQDAAVGDAQQREDHFCAKIAVVLVGCAGPEERT